MLAHSLGELSLYPPAYSAFSFRALMETPPKMVSCDSKKQHILTRSGSQPWRMVSSHQLLKRKLSESWRLRGIKGGLQSVASSPYSIIQSTQQPNNRLHRHPR